MNMDTYNYYRDPRVIARDTAGLFLSVDANRMTGVVVIEDQQHTVGIRFEVCDTCGGRGSHANPSIDAGGLSGDDMREWDEEEVEAYFHGGYDVACYECKGARVIPALSPRSEAEQAILTELEAQARENAADARLRAAERAMGA